MTIDVGGVCVRVFVAVSELIGTFTGMVTCDMVCVERCCGVLWGCNIPKESQILLLAFIGLGDVLSFDSQDPVIWVSIELRLDPRVIELNFVSFVDDLLEPIAHTVMTIPAVLSEVILV